MFGIWYIFNHDQLMYWKKSSEGGHSVVSDSSQPHGLALQTPLSMEFPRKEYWSGLPLSPSGDLPDPGIEPTSPALAGGFFTTEPPRKPLFREL